MWLVVEWNGVKEREHARQMVSIILAEIDIISLGNKEMELSAANEVVSMPKSMIKAREMCLISMRIQLN